MSAIQQVLIGISGALPAAPNPTFANVKLLVHFNGTDASTTFTDSSSTGRTLTANGNAQLDTSIVKYGTAAGLFDGSGDYVSGGGTFSDFAFGTGDFCVEFWAYRTATKSDAVIIATSTDGSANGGWWVNFNNTSLTFASSGVSRISATSVGSADSTWHHWVINRSGTTMRIFKDGIQIATTTNSTSYAAANLRFGGTELNGGFNVWFNGSVDDLRVTTGEAIYTTNFAVPTAQFPDS